MSQSPPVVGVVVADEGDLDAFREGIELLRACSVPFEVIAASTHLMPDQLREWAASARERGLQVLLVGADHDPHLPSAIAAQTILPIIALRLEPGAVAWPPIETAPMAFQGQPIATTGVGSSINAAMFALQILARFDQRWESSILKYRAHLRQQFRERAQMLQPRRTEAVPPAPPPVPAESEEVAYLRQLEASFAESRAQLVQPRPPAAGEPFLSTDVPPATASSPPVRHTDKPGLKREARHIGRIKVDPEMMALDIAENATDCLLDGGIVALPTDTVYGLAVDATNPDAVNALCELKGRDANRPIAVFIESQRQLAPLVRNLSAEVRQMLEAFWPGPLTVVFERRGHDFDYLAPGNTIGVRLPDHSIALALLQELRRPIACSSANPSGAPPARSADEVEQYFGEDVHMILDAGKLAPMAASTVIDVTRTPFRILRQGPITRDQLAAVLGDLLADEAD